jgi:hypothetical protein
MRLAVALLLLAALTGGAAAVVAWTQAGPGATGAFAVQVVGPGDASLFDGAVSVAEATALSALRATGLPLETREYPGMGTYVVAVSGIRASGASGWVYEVERDGATVSGDRTAAAFPLHKGDALRWHWTDG